MSERSIATGFRSASMLALGGDLDRAAAVLMEPVAGEYRIIGREIEPFSGDNGADLPDLLGRCCRTLSWRLERPLWTAGEGGPYLDDPEQALGLALEQVFATIDPLAPLRVWIGGLTAGESIAAAQQALHATVCAPAAVYQLGLQPDGTRLAADFAALRPDVLVVAGGYDQPALRAREPILALTKLITEAVRHLHPQRRPLLCFAGNRYAAEAVLEMWQKIPQVITRAVANVCPQPGIVQQSELAVMLSQAYWERCHAHPAMRRITRWITRPTAVRSTHWSFAQAVRLWQVTNNLPQLHGLYAGSQRWMHIWVVEGTPNVRIHFVQPYSRPGILHHWPPLGLVSGPVDSTALTSLWKRNVPLWTDASGLLPVIANVGQVNPLAALQVMRHDLLHQEK